MLINSNRLQETSDYYRKLLGKAASVLPQSVKQQSTDLFSEAGLPTPRHEDWKYTSLNHLYQATLPDASSLSPASTPLPLGEQKAFVVSVFGGQTQGQAPSGVSVHFSYAGEQQVLESSNQSLLQLSGNSTLFALNQASCQQLVHIQIAANCNVEIPIVLDYGCIAPDNQMCIKSTQVVVDLERSSRAQIVEFFRNDHGAKELELNSCLFNLAENAQCDHQSVQRNCQNNQQFWHGYAQIAADAVLNSVTDLFDGNINRHYFCADLTGKGAQAYIDSAYQAKGEQTMDSRTFVRHLAPQCDSHQLHQGLLNDQSSGVFSGRIFVSPEALQTNAQMDNNVILLSEQSQNNSKPQLEIYADDVKCSHGFTCGALDEQQLFYMRSRGMPEAQAKQYILKSFIAKVTDKLLPYLIRV